MDYVTARHSDYRELVQSGVRCGRLNSVLNSNNRWELECFIVADLRREEAKRLVEMYIHAQWEGCCFSYFTRTNAKQGQFFVRFTSFAL